ncbi:MAG: glycerol-3-phosphate dehydrogenase [Desulfobacterales bacterium]|nr:MAG: glycerol-3-phosphate dehydrogenase [Desulfobacterales bacterium]
MLQVPKIKKTAVIGAGSWGTALAILLAKKGEQVCLWGHEQEHIDNLEKDKENKLFLPDFPLPDNLKLTADVHTAVSSADCVVMVVPSHVYREVFYQVFPHLQEGTLIVSAVKGIEIGTRMTMHQIMEEISQEKKDTVHLGVISGPSFAREVAGEQPTAVTVAFKNEAAAVAVQQLFSTEYFRTYTSSDVMGLEINGALKNVIAIGAGISDGLGFGLNTRAALITRGLAEMSRMGAAIGADKATFAGLGGLGDLVLTCTGNLSRNRSVGLKLGEGKSLDQILAEMTMVAEGVKTTKSCYNLAKQLGVDMPILDQMYQVLYENKPCAAAVNDLFSRELKKEDF